MADIARQLEVALANAISPADIIVLVDASNSVSSTQFEIMRLCIRQLVDIFFNTRPPDSVRMALIQFATDIKIEVNLVNNPQTVNCAITAMSQMGGETNALGAFQNAKLIFETYNRSANRCIVFLTEGDCESAVEDASTMRDVLTFSQESTHIIAIGVELSDPTNLSKIASNGSYFLLNSFADLQQVFSHLHRTPTSPPKIDIISRGSHSATIQVVLPPSVLKFIAWEIEMFSFSSNKWVLMSSSQSDTQYLHDLYQNQKYKLRGRVLLLNHTWSEYSEEFVFRTLIEVPLSPVLRDPERRESECRSIVKYLRACRVDEHLQELGVNQINILFLGRIGAGKSSLLDSVASSLRGSYTVLAPFRSSLETVTHKLKKYPLTKTDSREPVINVFDIYGWSELNYKGAELGFILDGNVKSGYVEVLPGFQATKSNPYYEHNPSFNDKIHAVIIVVSAISVGSPAEMGKLKDFYALLTNRDYQPIFVMSKVDTLQDEAMIGHPENVYDSGLVDATMGTFCHLTDISRDSVLPVINYQGPYETPNYVVEMLALNILLFKIRASLLQFDPFLYALKAAVKTANTFLENHEEDIRKDFKENKERNYKKKSNKGKKLKDSEGESDGESEGDEESEEEEQESRNEEVDSEESEPVTTNKPKGKKQGPKSATPKKEKGKRSPPKAVSPKKEQIGQQSPTPKIQPQPQPQSLPQPEQPLEPQPFQLFQPLQPQPFQPQSFQPQPFQPQSFQPQPFQPQSFQPQPQQPINSPASPTGIMNLAEAALYLRANEADVEQLLQKKEIKGKQIGSQWRITKESIDNYLNE